MRLNRTSIELSSADIEAINWAIAILAAKLLPVLIALDDEDKSNLGKLGEKNLSFVEMCLLYAESDAEFLPEFLDSVKMQRDFATFKLLGEFLRPLAQITRNLDDTTTFYGSETLSACHAYFNSIRHAVELDAPNSSLIFNDLNLLFEAQKTRRFHAAALT
ncbi:MAG TPA: hypothetical protein VIL74_05595 [Pyrinomonadaceae bacterium]|jgi:hypothetical protein